MLRPHDTAFSSNPVHQEVMEHPRTRLTANPSVAYTFKPQFRNTKP